MGERSKLITETWLLKYSNETKHTADCVTAALKVRIASNISWRRRTIWTHGDRLHSQQHFRPAPQSWLGLQIALFLNFAGHLCSVSRKILCSTCDITILASSTFPFGLLLQLVMRVSVTTVYTAWLNPHFTWNTKMEAICFRGKAGIPTYTTIRYHNP